jgi:hypothetical protein
MTADLQVCWIDRDYDRDAASNRHGRYAAYLVGHARLFEPWRDAGSVGITLDPVDFAVAAFRIATGPIMSPGYVRWHKRVCDYGVALSDHDSSLLLSVTLAAPMPTQLAGCFWRSWQRTFFDDRYVEPPDDRAAALCRLELRWPVPADRLPLPTRPRRVGIPDPADATRAVEVLVDQVNTAAGPILGALEAGD